MSASEQQIRTRTFARVLGPFLVIVTVTGVLRASQMRELLSTFAANPMWAWVVGAFILLFGLVIIAMHQYWRGLAAIIVSLLGPPRHRMSAMLHNGLRTTAVKGLVAAVMAGALTIACPARADADPPAVGSPCSGNELNNTATASDGTAIRCLANEDNTFSWIADKGAAGTIAQLQSQGFTVTITRVGTGSLDQCKVTDVRNPNTTTYTTRSHPGASGVNTIVVSKTIDVALDCT